MGCECTPDMALTLRFNRRGCGQLVVMGYKTNKRKGDITTQTKLEPSNADVHEHTYRQGDISVLTPINIHTNNWTLVCRLCTHDANADDRTLP